MVKDHYTALGITPDADQEVIKAAFRALAKKYHPDTAADPGAAKAHFPEIAKARFREINEAHAVLSNPAARADYDRLLEPQRKKPFASSSREPGRLAERSETSKRQAPARFAHRVRYSAAAPFVVGLIPLVLLLLMLVGIAALVKH
jgi:curved DNA-binding protein CbpA